MLTKDGVFNNERIIQKSISFFYSDLYPVSVAILTLFFWLSGWQEVGFTLFVLIASFQFVIMRDMTPVLPMLLAIFFMPSDVNAFSSPWEYLIFLPAVICLTIHFIRFPVKKVKLGSLFFPFIGVVATFFLGGIFSEEIAEYRYGLVQIFGIGVGMFFAYFVLSQYICPPDQVDLKRFLFWTLFIVCAVPCVEMYCISILKMHSVNGALTYKTLGWGDKNFIGYMILVAVPTTYYFMVKAKNIIPYFIALSFYLVSAYFTNCDGAIGILVLFVPFITFFTYKRLEYRKRATYRTLFFILAILVIIELIIIVLATDDIWAVLSKRFLNDTGRTSIYKKGWKRFLKYPLFGNGAYYPNIPKEYVAYINYHSVIFHTLATTGILGFIAYMVYIIARFRVVTAKNNLFNLYAFFSILLYEAYCFVDCGEFLMIVIFINIITLVTERVNEQPDDRPRLFLNSYK